MGSIFEVNGAKFYYERSQCFRINLRGTSQVSAYVLKGHSDKRIRVGGCEKIYWNDAIIKKTIYWFIKQFYCTYFTKANETNIRRWWGKWINHESIENIGVSVRSRSNSHHSNVLSSIFQKKKWIFTVSIKTLLSAKKPIISGSKSWSLATKLKNPKIS